MTTLKILEQFKAPTKQRGMATLFSAILILLLMTAALIYSSRSALFDQRSAANSDRYSKAFAMAEAVTDVTVEYLAAANKPTLLDTTQAPWVQCSGEDICSYDVDTAGGEPAWYIADFLAAHTEVGEAIADLTSEAPDLTARVSVVLQYREEGVAVGSASPPAQAVFMIYGYGYSDCATPGDHESCQGEATVAAPLGAFALLSGPPAVPFTSKSFFDPNGSITIVTNPNGGGVGVPVSTWLNADEIQDGDRGIDLNPGAGSWQTCEYDEWYALDALPDYAFCPNQDTNNDGIAESTKPNCECTSSELLSGSEKGATQPLLDILVDDAFPDDLFYTFFGTRKENYEDVKGSIPNIGDCSEANVTEASSGAFWVTGDCNIQANRQIGTFDNPVVLISEGDVTINGATVFGLVFCTDAPAIKAGLEPSNGTTLSGNGVVYGSIVSDCGTFNTNGTFDLVYNGDILSKANAFGGLGAVSAGWRDFDVPAYPGDAPAPAVAVN